MNCMLWIVYGLPFVHPKSLLLVSTDSIGLAIQLVFLTIFFVYADKQGRKKVLRWMALEAIFMPIVLFLTIFYFHTIKSRTFFIGIPCGIFCITMYASPLTIAVCPILLVLINDQDKSVRYMPFWLSVGNLANGVIWTIYATLPFDPWIL
ncbi:Bidirectional sugar transporter SWEET5, partial [Bienertia sinuspersici]